MKSDDSFLSGDSLLQGPDDLGVLTRQRQSLNGFTLVEVLVASSIVALLVAMLITMVTQTSRIWRSTSGKVEEFRGASDAFDSMTRHLQQATLNTYLDYNNPQNPTSYMRQSQLRFLSGPASSILNNVSLPSTISSMAIFFQAPNGFSTNSSNSILQNALNTRGYFIEYAADSNGRPSFLSGPPKYRYRLMEFMEPTEKLSVYNYTTNPSYTNIDWITNSLISGSTRPVHVLAENVIAMVVLPKLSPADISIWNAAGSNYSASSLASNYFYSSAVNGNTSAPVDPNLNTHHQLPPVVQVTLIAVDETSAIRFPSVYANLTNTTMSLFTSAPSYGADLATLQSVLASNHMNFRIFTTDVMIRAAKWSASQTN
jgi:uncharacterized protein (TIGR02599 family)